MALVDAKIDGLRELTKSGFANIQRQLDEDHNLPVEVAELRTRLGAMLQRVSNLERENENRTHWVRANLPMLLISMTSLAASIALVVHQMLN